MKRFLKKDLINYYFGVNSTNGIEIIGQKDKNAHYL